ncbi:hypothetical protein QVD17_38635 [Tagetes erecta]|uniref:SUI1 domain-containing protein n=2 Tax=Heliantheae alliance TaxID=911341 RepID=A0AAD8N9I2_TARER|nr:hypothetical protein QVD17_38635 [Tagetes erecta]
MLRYKVSSVSWPRTLSGNDTVLGDGGFPLSSGEFVQQQDGSTDDAQPTAIEKTRFFFYINTPNHHLNISSYHSNFFHCLLSSNKRNCDFRKQQSFIQIKFMVDIEVQIPSAFDPFADVDQDSGGGAGIKEYVHIRIQQRNGRKSLTTVQGLKKELSYEKILKDLKKEFCCNGTVVQDKELGKVIQLQGDQRKNVAAFLSRAGIVKKDQIKIHGF